MDTDLCSFFLYIQVDMLLPVKDIQYKLVIYKKALDVNKFTYNTVVLNKKKYHHNE